MILCCPSGIIPEQICNKRYINFTRLKKCFAVVQAFERGYFLILFIEQVSYLKQYLGSRGCGFFAPPPIIERIFRGRDGPISIFNRS